MGAPRGMMMERSVAPAAHARMAAAAPRSMHMLRSSGRSLQTSSTAMLSQRLCANRSMPLGMPEQIDDLMDEEARGSWSGDEDCGDEIIPDEDFGGYEGSHTRDLIRGISSGPAGGGVGGRGGAAFGGPSAHCASLPPPRPAAPASNRAPSTGSAVTVKKWTPNASYAQAISKATTQAEKLSVYQREKVNNAKSPGFFFDVAAVFLANNDTKAMGIRCLSNVLEMALEDPHLIRVVGYRLVEAEQWDLAVAVFQHVMRLRRDEPQSYRDLALALATRSFDTNRPQLDPKSWARVVIDMLNAQYPDLGQYCPRLILDFCGAKLPDIQVSFDLLTKVVRGKWDKRFAEIELTALQELNQIVDEARRKKMWDTDTSELDKCDVGDRIEPKFNTFRDGRQDVTGGPKVPTPKDWALPVAKSRFMSHMPCDLRISLGWDTDMTDIDLHVVEPSGFEVYYQKNWSPQGGFISRDFTRGYGPEEYMVVKGDKGKYTIKAKYFSNSAQTLTGATTVTATVFTNWGRPTQKRQTITFRLEKNKDMFTVGTVALTK